MQIDRIRVMDRIVNNMVYFVPIWVFGPNHINTFFVSWTESTASSPVEISISPKTNMLTWPFLLSLSLCLSLFLFRLYIPFVSRQQELSVKDESCGKRLLCLTEGVTIRPLGLDLASCPRQCTYLCRKVAVMSPCPLFICRLWLLPDIHPHRHPPSPVLF